MTETTHNVDQTEIGKFEELAARWWDPDSEFKPLHDINPLRLDYIDRAAKLKGKEVLDVGCGGGILSESMAVLGARVTGIDLGERPLQVAELHTLDITGMTYNPLTDTYRLADRDPDVNYLMTCRLEPD